MAHRTIILAQRFKMKRQQVITIANMITEDPDVFAESWPKDQRRPDRFYDASASQDSNQKDYHQKTHIASNLRPSEGKKYQFTPECKYYNNGRYALNHITKKSWTTAPPKNTPFEVIKIGRDGMIRIRYEDEEALRQISMKSWRWVAKRNGIERAES